MERLRGAFGFGADEVKEGDAFNRELQEQKRLDRIAERDAKEKERRCVGGAVGAGPAGGRVACACMAPLSALLLLPLRLC